jgi:hypothetical protein
MSSGRFDPSVIIARYFVNLSGAIPKELFDDLAVAT